MSSGSKREKFKTFIRQPFSRNKGKTVANDIQSDTPATSLIAGSSGVAVNISSPNASAPKIVVSDSSPQAPGIYASSTGGILTHASQFTMINPVMMDNPTVNIHEADDKRSKALELLSKHVIPGAAHDSSARDPPPRCHPGTRIQINEHIITWFYDEEKKELLIWIYGPAGVGKSAIMQTLAEKLAESKHLGASAFVSRPNGRNSSRQLFLTIAYQLAVHDEDYCTFVTEKLRRDPQLVNKAMEEQFKAFIVEPFAVKKISAGGAPWGILLDGLDELDEHRSQREVIRLITGFILEHPDAPLLWAIASRPEPHICDTFDDEKFFLAYWRQFVPANSKESREDVEYFLKASLERIKKDFPRTVPPKWPSEEHFSRLAAASSGLFAFADTTIRFIEDPRYANPSMRLNQVLSALNGLTVTPHDRPFMSLDALYTSILSSIPSDVWPTTRRVLGVLLYAQGEGFKQVLRMLIPLSIILRLDLSTSYASVHGVNSLLLVPDPEVAGSKSVTFYHASFGDYLLDSIRSNDFHISMEEVEDDLLQSSLNIWQEFKTSYPPVPGLVYESRWLKHFSVIFRDLFTGLYPLFQYIHEALFTFLVDKHDPKGERTFLSQEDQQQCLNLLSQLEDATVCWGFAGIGKLSEFFPWLFDMWEVHQEKLVSKGVIQEVGLDQVQISQFRMHSTAQMQLIQGKSILHQTILNDPSSTISYLKTCASQPLILACGHQGNSCLFFRLSAETSDLEDCGLDSSVSPDDIPASKYFAIPSSQSYFYHDAEHFLRIKFEAVQVAYSQLLPNTWPSKEQLLKLGRAMSCQPLFTDLAIQFIENCHLGDPDACLNQILALMDEVDPSNHQPFIYVDALYTHILHSSFIWPIIQQVLGAYFYGITHRRSSLITPMGISVVIGIELGMVYSALRDCYPMVLAPPDDTPLGSLIFRHSSFFDYLMDQTRSQVFYISMKDAEDHIHKLLIKIWQYFNEQAQQSRDWEYWNIWMIYCSYYHPDTLSLPSPLTSDFTARLFCDTHQASFFSIRHHSVTPLKLKETWDQVLDILKRLDFITLHAGFVWQNWYEFTFWLFDIWNIYPLELAEESLVHQIRFQDLQFVEPKHYNVFFHVLCYRVGEQMQKSRPNSITSPEEFDKYISGLKQFQQHQPQLRVLIGGRPGGRFAVFGYEYTEADLKEQLHHPQGRSLKAGDLGYYILPYPDNG